MIVIFCPRSNATGGTELLHQLGYKLNLFGYDARMYYYGDDDGRPAVHPHFIGYNVKVIKVLSDSSDNVFIYPEEITSSLEGIKQQLPLSKHVLWWLSVDNANMTPELEKFVSGDKELIHFVQSYYADDYVRTVLNVPDERVFYLSDYLNNSFLNMESGGKREDIVLFNPRKGFERTSSIIKNSDHRIKWQALAGLSPKEIPDILQTAKVYIDFGNHPGKDRFPREAVSCGCRIITGRKGAAANDRDIPIPEQLKVTDDTDDDTIIGLICTLIENYEQTEELYREYKKRTDEEFHTFEADTLKVFSSICNDQIDGGDLDEDELKAAILDAVSGEDYKRAFYLLAVFRIKGYKSDKDMMILEGYTRLGLNEDQVAIYLMNRLTATDPENYEAYLIKARAMIALGEAGAEEILDLSVKYSKGTVDEEYIIGAVSALRQ